MKARINVDYLDHKSRVFPVHEIVTNRLVCLSINGTKTDFGMSEIELLPDASLGREVVWQFRKANEGMRTTREILTIARRAKEAWGGKLCTYTEAVSKFMFE